MKIIFLILFFICISVKNQSFSNAFIKKYKQEAKMLNIDLGRYLQYSNFYSKSIREASRKYSIPASLIEAIISIESNWYPNVKNQNNCCGLMQIRNGTFDTHLNILSGTKILRRYLDIYENDTTKALTAYNYGYMGTKKYYKKYNKPSNYAIRVLKLFRFFEKIKKYS